MKIQSFQDLRVWKNAHKLTLEIYKVTKDFPEDERFGLVSQIRRSAVSICANISEGTKKSTKDFVRFLCISQGSLEETKYHLILSKDLQYCNKTKFNELIDLSNDVGKMLSGLIRSLKLKII